MELTFADAAVTAEEVVIPLRDDDLVADLWAANRVQESVEAVDGPPRSLGR